MRKKVYNIKGLNMNCMQINLLPLTKSVVYKNVQRFCTSSCLYKV